MRRSRGSEMPQRQSPRGPHSLRTSSSSDSDHRSPKLGDHRSPRGTPQSNPLNQKKLGTRIADLESQLGQAQVELKSLKVQLVSAEAAKKEAQEQLEKKSKKQAIPPRTVEIPENDPAIDEVIEDNQRETDVIDDNQRETDVFEVPEEKVAVEQKIDLSRQATEEGKETKPVNMSTDTTAVSVADDLSLVKEDIDMLKLKLEKKEKEIEVLGKENESLKKQLDESASINLSAESKNEETMQNLTRVEEELKASKDEGVSLKLKLEAMEREKEAIEAEMKKMKVQTEQWRKAADAAAAVLAGGLDMNAGGISGRCGSMDKHFGGIFDPSGGRYAGFVESNDDYDDGFDSGKKKGSGIKMFGDLWKKKGHK